MIGKTRAHETSVSLAKADLGDLDAGADIALKVRVSCASACDLRGSMVNIIAQDAAVVKQVELATFDGAVNETDEFFVKVPIEPGRHTWTVEFPAQEKEGALHEASSARFSLVVKPHAASAAVWGVPSPLVPGEGFTIKVGVKCAAACSLAGKRIEVHDHEGAPVASATLGHAPWPGTDALYWTDVRLKAPAAEGTCTWTARFLEPDGEASHEGALQAFGLRIGRLPEHVVTVEVAEEETKIPLKNAHILLHPYSGQTNDRGVAELRVPKGSYKLYVTKNEYRFLQTAVEVESDVEVSVGLAAAPHDANDEG